MSQNIQLQIIDGSIQIVDSSNNNIGEHSHQNNSIITSTQEQYVWTDSIEQILDKMRINCINLSEYHIYNYRRCKLILIHFRIPIIILSAANVFLALGMLPYLSQSNISVINSVVSLFCGLLTSIELFLNIQKNMENNLISHKDYYRLGIDIYKILALDRSTRKVDGKTFLDQKFSEYEKLIQSSNTVNREYVFDTLSSHVPIVVEKRLKRSELDIIESHSEFNINKYIDPKINMMLLRRKDTARMFYRDLPTIDSSSNDVTHISV